MSGQDSSQREESTYTFFGATVAFAEHGQIAKVSLPSDFSYAQISGFAMGVTNVELVQMLHNLGFDISSDCVRSFDTGKSSLSEVVVRVEDPSFVEALNEKLILQGSNLRATPVMYDHRGPNQRKVYISWHKPTRSVWLNFGSGEVAERVARKFSDGRYTCLGRHVKSTTPKKSSYSSARDHSSFNPMAWTIILSDVPADAETSSIRNSITLDSDRPRHIEMGDISYSVSAAEASVEIRSRLESYGPLESFYLTPTPSGKRMKVTAWFQDEADARSACALNNQPLEVLRQGKLTVTLVKSVKIKVLTTIYLASRCRVEATKKDKKYQHISCRIYSDSSKHFTTFKIEGEDSACVAGLKRALDGIFSGIVLTSAGKPIWTKALASNGEIYHSVKLLEGPLGGVILRDKSRNQLKFHGPEENVSHAVHRISEIIIKAEAVSFPSTTPNLLVPGLTDGGSKIVRQTPIHGHTDISSRSRDRSQQCEMVMSTSAGISAREHQLHVISPSLKDDCVICLCPAEIPIETSCKHIYCLECFEGCCKSAVSTSQGGFRVTCLGNEGLCAMPFTLSELKDHLSSSVLETDLKAAFEQHIRRHPSTFRQCPIPNCDYVYRCTAATGTKSLILTCSNCFEAICTACHAKHGEYTCAEYQDIASGGYEALARLKKELNIKDCPNCTTPIEKTEGCNHMTCGGCKIHLCWVCMTTFETGGPCYAHMTREHGGIGLGLEHLVD